VAPGFETTLGDSDPEAAELETRVGARMLDAGVVKGWEASWDMSSDRNGIEVLAVAEPETEAETGLVFDEDEVAAMDDVKTGSDG